jgi:uncharacterized protein (DUF1778 family)
MKGPSDKQQARFEPEGRKNQRLAVRLSADNKALLEQAALETGSTLSEFVVNSALAAARDVIENVERMVLRGEDRDFFLAMLENPPEPNEALREAAARYKEFVSKKS